jgi:hypothetical protein
MFSLFTGLDDYKHPFLVCPQFNEYHCLFITDTRWTEDRPGKDVSLFTRLDG